MQSGKQLEADSIVFLNVNLPNPTLAHQVHVHDSTEVEGKTLAGVTWQMAELPPGR